MSRLVKYNFTPEQIAKLLSMQNELNTYIHPEWKTQGFNWDLAIIDECMEIHGHLGWKWWKKDYQVGMTEQNKKQIQLEVIDILHFFLSSWIQSENGKYIEENVNFSYPDRDLKIGYQTNRMLRHASAHNSDYFGEVWTLMAHSVGLTEQEIMETYTQKYVLNKFRQDHGYKTGEYVKVWQESDESGRILNYEDNEVLANIVSRMHCFEEDTTNETLLYNSLKVAYNSRLNK